MTRLRLFGSVEVTHGDGTSAASVLVQTKRVALLSYLVLAHPRGLHRRDKLLALFWPEKDQEHARHALRQSLYFLRKSLGDDVIVSQGDEEVGIGPNQVSVDVLELEEALASSNVRRALELYEGELMDGFFVSASPEFDQWLDGERSRLREDLWKCVTAAATAAEAKADLSAAVGLAATAARLRPMHEASVRTLMDLLGQTGDRPGALRVFDQLSDTLETEFEVEPAPETRRLADAIRDAHGTTGARSSSVTHHVTARAERDRATSPVRSRGGVGWRVPVLALTVMAVTAIALVSTRGSGGLVAPAAGVWEIRLALIPPENQSGDSEWDFLTDQLDDAMRLAIGRYAPGVDVLARFTTGDATSESEDLRSRAMRLAREAGATHVITSRYSLGPNDVALTMQVLDASTGESLRTFDPVRAVRDSIEAVVRGAGDKAAVATMLLETPEGENQLRYHSVPSSPSVVGLIQQGLQAFRLGRWDDATERFYQVLELEPDYPGAYAQLFFSLGGAGRLEERAALEPRYRSLIPVMTRADQLEMMRLLSTTVSDRLDAQEALYRLTNGREGNLAFIAIQANRLHLAREALDTRDFERPDIGGYFVVWLLDVRVHHLLGDYRTELQRVREGVERLAPNAQQRVLEGMAGEELRALIALDSIDAAWRAFGEIDEWPNGAPRHLIYMSQAALEFRRHGHLDASERAYGEILDFVEGTPEIGARDKAQAYYEAGRYDRAIPLLVAELEEVDGLDRMAPAAMLVISLDALGRSDEASQYEGLLSDFDSDSNHPGRKWAALVPASRGDPVVAVRLLREAFDAGVPVYHSGLNDLMMHERPEFEPIRDDPAFRRLMEPR